MTPETEQRAIEQRATEQRETGQTVDGNPGQMLRVRLVKSYHGRLKKHKACVRGLGLRRIGHTVDVEDTPSVRGMIAKVGYMVEVVS